MRGTLSGLALAAMVSTLGFPAEAQRGKEPAPGDIRKDRI
jgi:hypothetical protein